MLYRRFAIACLLFAATLSALAGCESKPADANGTTQTLTEAAATSQAKPKPKLRPGAKTKVLAAAGDSDHDKTFDDLRFDIKVDEPFRREKLTDEIEALDGKPMRIRGFILPTPQTRGIKQFVLVRDNQECCFGPGAALFDCILVDMQPGVTAEYTIRPVAVSGNFQIKEFVIDGRHLAIYHIDADKVK
jgi:hypothetical protein